MNNRKKYALAQEITNRAVLTQLANRGKSDEEAYNYLTGIKSVYKKSLELQVIPLDEELWKLENFETFLQKRREMLANQLNKYLNSFSETIEGIGYVTIDELIGEGESQELELKTSFHWNMEENKIDPNYRYAIYRTVAAFANSKGGTLILGVNDEGGVEGLAMDYSSIGGDREEFEYYIKEQLLKELPQKFVEEKVLIGFYNIEEKDICRIDIKGNKSPIFIHRAFDKTHDAFYIRTGTFSKEIKTPEMDSYIKDNFKS